MKIQPVIFIPEAEPVAVGRLPLLLQRQEGALGARLHHMMKAKGNAVGQPFYKGILLRQQQKLLLGLPIFGDKARHFRREFIGEAHHRKELP